MAEHEYHHLRPAGAPPLLTADQVLSLCSNGWLEYDLPTQLQAEIDDLQTTAAKFFKQDDVTKINTLANKNFEDEGYYDIPEEKEYVTYRRRLAKDSDIQNAVENVWSKIANILHRMLCDLSRAGNLDVTAWDEVIKGTLSFPPVDTDLRNSATLLRLFRYEPDTGTSEKHADLGLLTMCVGYGAGLEVLDIMQQPASWKGAPRCTILVGETLRKLASDNIRVGIHRVVPNPKGRQSLVYALRPNLAGTVNLEDFGGDGIVKLRDIFQEIKGSKYNVNAKLDVRERQCQLHRARQGIEVYCGERKD